MCIATVYSSRSIVAYYHVRVFDSNVSPGFNPPLHLFDDKLHCAGQKFLIQPKTPFLCID